MIFSFKLKDGGTYFTTDMNFKRIPYRASGFIQKEKHNEKYCVLA